MKPAAFSYLRADTIEEALAALAAEGGEARIIAGGQSLLPMLNMRLARPQVLVDIMHLPDLACIEVKDDHVRIGAGVRQAQLLAWEGLEAHLPLIARALPHTGHVQTRARGTVCGSIAHADPSAELPLVLSALGGTVHLRSAKARRALAADAFFTGMMSTAKAENEMIEAVSFPRVSGVGVAFEEVARRHGDFAIVACAAVVSARGIRLCVGGVGDRPEAQDWPLLEGAALEEALNAFAWRLNARDDFHASARYRRDLVRTVGRRVIEEARRCRG